MSEDIRWVQRLSHYKKALNQLGRFLAKPALNELEEQGLIQSFEYNYELAWNLIKDFYEYQGVMGIQGSKDAFRMAYQKGLIDRGDLWMKMIQSRALTSHIYNETTAKEVIEAIKVEYYPLFVMLRETFESIL